MEYGSKAFSFLFVQVLHFLIHLSFIVYLQLNTHTKCDMLTLVK